MAKRVLIVDDEEPLLTSLKTLATIWGYEASIAKNSSEAFTRIEDFNPDMILLDFNLKEKLTGMDILKKVKQEKPHVKVVMITGLGDGEAIETEANALGADKFLHKPLSTTQIKELLHELIPQG